jgi:hypothetical protein
MSFIQNLLFLVLFLGHNQPIIEPQCIFCILVEMSNLWATFLHSSFDVGHGFVIIFCSNDLTLQGGVGVMLNNHKFGNTRVLDSSLIRRTTSK